MADEQIVQSLLSMTGKTDGNKAATPAFYTGSYVAADTKNYLMRIPSSGKGRLLYAIDNQSDQDITIKLYGAFVEDGEIGDVGVFPIDATGITASASGGKIQDTTADPYPWFYIRCSSSVAGDSKTVTVYSALMAY